MKKSDPKVPLAMSEVERRLILDALVDVEDDYASVIRATPTDQPVRFALDDWKGLGDCIAAEANHTRDRRLKKELDRLHARIRKLLDNDEPQTALKIYRGEDESEE